MISNHLLKNIKGFISCFSKEWSLCNKLWFSHPYIFATQCRRPEIFQNMNSVRLNSLSLEYQRFTALGCKDMRIKKFEFVAKIQFLSFLTLSKAKWFFVKCFFLTQITWQSIYIISFKSSRKLLQALNSTIYHMVILCIETISISMNFLTHLQCQNKKC